MDFNLIDLDPKMDRRQKKTRQAVESALLELLKDKTLDSITISELAEKADINRKTFYNNFASIEEVVDVIEQKIITYIFAALPEKITINNEIEIYHLFLSFSKTIEPQKQLFGQITKTTKNLIIIDHLKDQIEPYIEYCLSSYKIDPVVVPYINNYVINGLSSIYYEWFNDPSLSAESVALLAYNLTSSAIRLDNYRDIKPTTV